MENSDHKQQDKQEDQENHHHQQGYLCNLENIENKGESKMMIEINGEDEEEGFKTPTKKEHRIAVDIRHPPPAPKKPKSQPMKRRRPSRRTLFQVSTADIELLFPAVLKEKDHKDSSVSISNDSAANINNKVNTSNYTTTTTSSPPLMSLR